MHLKIADMCQFWGKATVLFSSVLWICSALCWYWDEPTLIFTVMSLGVSLLGLILINIPCEPQTVHGIAWFLEILLFWHIISALAALPFYWMIPNTSWVDAYFEAISGLTTTGIEVLSVANMSNVMLFYHQALQFLGGIGVIVFILAIFPERFQNAAKLFNIEVTGPDGNKQFLTKVNSSARAFSGLYVMLSFFCMVAFIMCGMDPFFALCEAFGIISTGGFSIHPSGLLYYENDAILWVAMAFMLLGSLSFRCHYLVFVQKAVWAYFQDRESRYFLTYIVAVCFFYVLYSVLHKDAPLKLYGLYQIMSMLSTTGIQVSGLHMDSSWLFLLSILACVGGCAGSTSGGIKFARLIYLYRQFKRSLFYFINTHQVMPDDAPDALSLSLQGLGAIILWSFLFFAFLMMMAGLDVAQGLQLSLSTVSCVGGMLMQAVPVAEASHWVKFIASEAMVAGRMELMVFWTLFTLRYWRK